MRFLARLCVFLALLCGAAAQAAFTHVQGTASGGTISGANQCTLSFSAVGSGNTVVGAGRIVASTLQVSSIKDNATPQNTYTIKDNSLDASDIEEVFTFVLGNIAGGPTTLTFTFTTGSGNPCDMVMDEYSGALAASDPTDGHNIQFQAAPGTGANAIQSPSVTTTVNGDLIYGASFSTSNTPAPTAGTSPLTFTAESSATTTGIGSIRSEDAVQSSAGATHTAFTDATNGGGANYNTFVMAIQPAAGAAACPPPSLALMGVGC